MNRTRIAVAHNVTALMFHNITRCFGKHVAVFAVAEATGDIIQLLTSISVDIRIYLPEKVIIHRGGGEYHFKG